MKRSIHKFLGAVLSCVALALSSVMGAVRRSPLFGSPLEGEFANGAYVKTRRSGNLPYLSDVAIGRSLLLKIGSDARHVTLSGTGDNPTLLALDETTAAEQSLTCRSIPSGESTIRLVSDGTAAVNAGDWVIAAANGQAKSGATTTGNYWIVGRALTAVANGATGDDAEFEAEPVGCFRTVP